MLVNDIPRGALRGCTCQSLNLLNHCRNFNEWRTRAVDDVQVKYGSKVTNRNVISTLFMRREPSLITGVKMERMLLSAVIQQRHCNDCTGERRFFLAPDLSWFTSCV